MALVSDRSGSDDLWIVPVHEGAPAGEPRRITHGEAQVNLPTWSPDGSEIAFVGTADGKTSVWIVQVEGEGRLRPVEGPPGPRFVRWSRAGDALLVSGHDESQVVRLFEVDLESFAVLPVVPEVVFGDNNATGAFDLSTDDNLIAFTQENTRSELWILGAKRGRF